MPTWSPDNVILTDAGQQILAKLSLGKGSIEITNIKVGLYVSDTDPNISDLSTVTDIQHIATTINAGIIGVTSEGNFSNVEISVENTVNTESVTKFCQIGIYAKYSGDGKEVLYMIAQCNSGEYEQLPAYSETPTALFYNLRVYHGYEGGMTATIAENSYVDPTRVVSLESRATELENQVEALTSRKLYVYSEAEDLQVKFSVDNPLVDRENVVNVGVFPLIHLSGNYYYCLIPYNANSVTLIENGESVITSIIPQESFYNPPLLVHYGSNQFWANYLTKKFTIVLEGVSVDPSVKITINYSYEKGNTTVSESTTAIPLTGKAMYMVNSEGNPQLSPCYKAELPIFLNSDLEIKWSVNGAENTTTIHYSELAFTDYIYINPLTSACGSLENIIPLLFSNLVKGEHNHLSAYIEKAEDFATRIILNSGEIVYDYSNELDTVGYSCREVRIGTCCTKICDNAFSMGTVGSVFIPDTVESIGSQAFNSATKVYIGNYPVAVEVSDTAFENSEMVTYAYENPTDVTMFFAGSKCIYNTKSPNIGYSLYDFDTESVTKIVVGSNVNALSIANRSSGNKFPNLESIKIVEEGKVLILNTYSFYGCSKLTSITLPRRVKNIPKYFMDGITGTKNVYIDNNPSGIAISAIFDDTFNVYYKYLGKIIAPIEGDTVLVSNSHNVSIPAHYVKENHKVTVYFSSISASDLESSSATGSSIPSLSLPFKPSHEFAQVVNQFYKNQVSGYTQNVKEMVICDNSTEGTITLTLDIPSTSTVSFISTGIKGGVFTYFTSE